MTEIRLKYFDTVPVAVSMCVLKSGFLFVAAEFGNQSVSVSCRLPVVVRLCHMLHHGDSVAVLPIVVCAFCTFCRELISLEAL